MPPTVASTSRTFGAPKAKIEHVGGAGDEIVGAAHHVGHQHRLDVGLGQAGGREHGARDDVDRAHGGIADRHALALEVGDRCCMPLSLRTKNGVRSAWIAPIRRRSVDSRSSRPSCTSMHVGDADLGLAAADHGDDHGVAGGRLHQHVDAALFLQHLGDGGRGGVVERARRHRGEAVGLRRGRCRRAAPARRSAPHDPAQQSSRNDDMFVSSLVPRSLHSAGGKARRWAAPTASRRPGTQAVGAVGHDRQRSATSTSSVPTDRPSHSRRREITKDSSKNHSPPCRCSTSLVASR